MSTHQQPNSVAFRIRAARVKKRVDEKARADRLEKQLDWMTTYARGLEEKLMAQLEKCACGAVGPHACRNASSGSCGRRRAPLTGLRPSRKV